MTEAPKWEDRYHPKKIHARGSAPRGWAPEYQYCPYVREDEHDRIVAEKDAEITRLTSELSKTVKVLEREKADSRQMKHELSGKLGALTKKVNALTAERDAIAAMTVERCAECCDEEADRCDDAVKWGGHVKYIANCKAAVHAMRDRAAAIRYLSKQAEKG